MYGYPNSRRYGQSARARGHRPHTRPDPPSLRPSNDFQVRNSRRRPIDNDYRPYGPYGRAPGDYPRPSRNGDGRERPSRRPPREYGRTPRFISPRRPGGPFQASGRRGDPGPPGRPPLLTRMWRGMQGGQHRDPRPPPVTPAMRRQHRGRRHDLAYRPAVSGPTARVPRPPMRARFMEGFRQGQRDGPVRRFGGVGGGGGGGGGAGGEERRRPPLMTRFMEGFRQGTRDGPVRGHGRPARPCRPGEEERSDRDNRLADRADMMRRLRALEV